MSGIGPGAVMLSQTPDDNFRRLNDFRVTDLYATNIVQPVFDAFPGQLERLPLESVSSIGSTTVTAGSVNSNFLTFPEDGYVETLLVNTGLQPVGAAPGGIALQLAYVSGLDLRYRWLNGTVLGLGRDGYTDFLTWNFNPGRLYVRAGDLFNVAVRNTTAGAVTGVAVSASFRRIQP
jgi:hypothetical protein